MNKKRVSIAVAVLVLLSISAYLLYRALDERGSTNPREQPSGAGVVGNASIDTDPFDVLITYTDNGYSPREISIPMGTRVRFLNESSEGSWPASGIHPTHTLYPEKSNSDCLGSSFDACRALEPGEFFDFTFNYTGRWTFHDHNHAYHSGSITVTEKSTQ